MILRLTSTLAVLAAPAFAQEPPQAALDTLSAELNSQDEVIQTTFAAVGCRITFGFQEQIRDDLTFATLARVDAAQLDVDAASPDALEGETRIGIPVDGPNTIVLTARGGDEDDETTFVEGFGGECGPEGCRAELDIAFFPVAVRGEDHEARTDAVLSAMDEVATACGRAEEE